jgi:hypothetical protein
MQTNLKAPPIVGNIVAKRTVWKGDPGVTRLQKRQKLESVGHGFTGARTEQRWPRGGGAGSSVS